MESGLDDARAREVDGGGRADGGGSERHVDGSFISGARSLPSFTLLYPRAARGGGGGKGAGSTAQRSCN